MRALCLIFLLIFTTALHTEETFSVDQKLFPPDVVVDETAVTLDQLKPAPPLGFAPRLPIQMNVLNKTFRNQKQQQESMRNVNLVYDRTFPWKEWGKLGIGLAALFVIVWLSKRKGLQGIQREERILSARDRALHALQANLLVGPIEYVQLSDILRDYLGERYKIPTDKKTTQEVLKHLARHKEFNTARRQFLARILGDADRVKFALYTPSPQDCQEAQTLAHHIISPQP